MAWLSLVVPVAIILGWGAAFLTSCVVALSAGGSPVVYRYSSPGGILTARASDYRWSIPRNTLQLRGVEITDPEMQAVMSAKELLLEDFVPGAKPVRVRARDIFLRVERKPDGKLRLFDWAPPSTEEESKVAYSVDLGRVSVLWDDFAGGKRWRRWVSSPRVRVDGRGSTWMASSTLKIERSGFVSVRLNGAPKLGFEGDIQLRDLEIGELIERFGEMPEAKELPELRDLSARSARLTGPLRVVAKPDAAMSIVGRLGAEAAGLSYGPDFAADRVSAEAIITPKGIRGRANVVDRGLSGSFAGVAVWEPKLVISGAIVADVPRERELPKLLRDTLPKDLALQKVHYDGWLDYREPAGWATVGDLAASSIRFGGETVTRASAVLSYQSDQLVLAGLQGTYQSAPLSGAIDLDLKSKTLRGQLVAARMNIETLADHFGFEGIEGTGEARVALTGTLDRPSIDVRATGQAQSRLQGYDARLGRFELAAQVQSNSVSVDRLTVIGPSGTAYARGLVDLRKRSLAFDVLATSVPLGSFFDAVEASAAFSGTIGGTFEKPLAKGQLELFGAVAAGQLLPYARGDVEIDRKGLTARQVLAFKRGATARGDFGITFGNQALSGNFTTTGVNLADYPPEGISGIARITRATLSGTLSVPILEADVTADTLVLADIRFGEVSAKARIEGRTLFIEQASAASESGELRGSAMFSLDDDRGTFDFETKQFALASLLRGTELDVSVGGLLDGRARGSFTSGTVSSLAADGQVSGLRINQAFLGNGPIAVNAQDGKWTGSVFLGDLNAYVEIPKMSYDEATKQLSGDIVANNFNLEILYKSFDQYLVDRMSADLREKLASTTGQLDLSAQISGPADNLNVDVSTLTLDNLDFEGQDAGKLSLRGKRENRVWTFEELGWAGGPALVKLNRARIEEDGKIDVDGEINDLRWSWFAPFMPALAKVRGQTDFPFLITGQTNSPEIQASLSYEEMPPTTVIRPWPGTRLALRDPKARARRVDLDTVAIAEGAITASGVYNVDGFTGPIEARIPFNYPFTIPDDKEIFAQLTLPERPLDSLTDFLPGLDVGRSEGSVHGQVQIRGLRDSLKVTGLAEAKAKQFAWKGIATALQEMTLTASFNGETVGLQATAQGSDGGSLAIEEAGFRLGNLSEVLESSTDALLAKELFGSLKLNDFKMFYSDPKEGLMTGTVGGSLSLSGPLQSPLVSGQLLVSAVDAAPPSTLAAGTRAPNLPVDPRFDVNILATDSMRLRLSTGNFFMGGSGRLSGRLSSPDFTSTLLVEKGSIRLPNARINIEPGGEILITYRPGANGATAARAELNMVGRTQVSAESFTGNIERYDVILNITGDLLKEGGLQLAAQSDPPDLSQERILTILGQGDVLGGRRGETFRADRQLQSALIGIALPYVAGSLTERLAEQLGLDYLNIEYNSFDRLSVTAAISLGRDIVLSGRRQISDPIPGSKPKYEVRLSYRPPFRNRALRRFSFSIGTDQDRPWKIMIEYGIRF